jgi:ABC-2 type transport system permease protein
MNRPGRPFRRTIQRVYSTMAAYLRLDAVEEFSYPFAFAVSEASVLVPLVVYLFVGQLVGGSPRVGGDYFTFATVGLALAAMLQASLSGFGGALTQKQNRGQLETLLAEPLPWSLLPFAMNAWHVVLGITNGALILLVGAALGADLRTDRLDRFLLLALLGVTASVSVGMLSASLMVLAKRAAPILALYGAAASFLGGAFFSVDQLPGWLKPLSWVVPHTYVINAARAALMDDPGTFVVTFSTAVLALSVFNVVALLVGVWTFGRALQYARRAGSLGGY